MAVLCQSRRRVSTHIMKPHYMVKMSELSRVARILTSFRRDADVVVTVQFLKRSRLRIFKGHSNSVSQYDYHALGSSSQAS
jgi:hypothetical protein